MFQIKSKFLAVALSFFACANIALAAGTTIIPEKIPTGAEDEGGLTEKQETQNTLAEKFKTGEFEVYDLADYVVYLIEALIYLAGGISVLFVVIGGYKYMIGAISDDKEAGKKTIGYALGGFAVAVLAWTIVNFVQVWLTSG